jgi:tRNA(fMet)-specific endonuclease VapC
MLDTNVCIHLLNERDSPVARRLSSLHRKEAVLCSISKAELYYGAYRSTRREANLAVLRRFFQGFETLGFDEKCEEVYGVIRARLSLAGTPIGPNDLLIAAVALANEATLVTHNTAEFGRVKGLRVEDWESTA